MEIRIFSSTGKMVITKIYSSFYPHIDGEVEFGSFWFFHIYIFQEVQRPSHLQLRFFLDKSEDSMVPMMPP